MKKQFYLIIFCSLFTAFASSANENMLINSGFEAGLTGWVVSDNTAIRTGDPAPFEGENYVYGKKTPLFRVWQDVDLINKGIMTSGVDAGNFIVEFGGWQSSYKNQSDSGQIFIHLFDANMALIESSALPSFFSNHTWVEQSSSIELPFGTRFIRYEFVGTRFEGSNTDAYLDATYLNIISVNNYCVATYTVEGLLNIPCVSVPDALGGHMYYQANMQFVPFLDPFTFKLTAVQQIGGAFINNSECLAVFNNDSVLNIPCVSIPSSSGNTEMFEAQMEFIPLTSPFVFELIEVHPTN